MIRFFSKAIRYARRMYWISLLTTTLVGVEFVGKVRFSILEKTQDRILREDMTFKGIASRGAATGPRQRPFQAGLDNTPGYEKYLV